MPVIEFALPANMEEIIAAGKYLPVVEVLNTVYKNQSEARWAMLQTLTGLTGFDLGKQLGAPTPASRTAAAENIDWYDAMEIADNVFPAMDFIFDNEPFLTNPIKQFTHNGILYEGPDDKLLNQTGAEWKISHHAQVLYTKTNDEKHLRTMLAANWHPVVTGNRCMLCEDAMEQKQFDTLPVEIVRGFYLWYLHCEKFWNDKFELLYINADTESKPAKGKEVWDLMFELSGNSLGVNYDIVQTRTRQEVFMGLEKLEKTRQELERQSKS